MDFPEVVILLQFGLGTCTVPSARMNKVNRHLALGIDHVLFHTSLQAVQATIHGEILEHIGDMPEHITTYDYSSFQLIEIL